MTGVPPDARQTIRSLLADLADLGLAEMSCTAGDLRLHVKYAPRRDPARPVPVAAPVSGVHLLRHPQSCAAMPASARARRGDVVAFIADGVLLHPVLAPRHGHVHPTVAEGEMVSAGASVAVLTQA